MNIRIILTADTHLRVSQYARTSRGDDFAAAMLDVFNTAVREKISTVCISGDLLDSTRPSPKIIAFLKALDQQACLHGVLLLVTSGNHDFTEPHWATVAGMTGEARRCGLRIIDNQLVTLPDSGIRIYGLPYMSKEKFLEVRDSLPPADILMFHATIQELTHFKTDSALSLADLPTDKYQVIALGDIHRRQYVKVGQCLVGQPGSTELCEVSEPEDKTVTVVSFDDARRRIDEPLQLLPVKTRQVLRFNLRNEEDLEKALLLAETQKEQAPIVVVEYDVSLLNVQQRFASRLDPTKVILRFFPSFQKLKNPNLGSDLRESLPLQAFFDKLQSPGTPLHTLGTSLLSPDANAVELIDRYIEERRKQLLAA